MGKKLLLTSDGLTTPKLRERFLELVGKDPKDIKILFVPTASDAKRDVDYLEIKIHYFKFCEKNLINLGIPKENWFWLNTISSNNQNNENLLEINNYNKFVEELKSEDFKKMAVQYINMKNYAKFVLMPQK